MITLELAKTVLDSFGENTSVFHAKTEEGLRDMVNGMWKGDLSAFIRAQFRVEESIFRDVINSMWMSHEDEAEAREDFDQHMEAIQLRLVDSGINWQ